MAVGIQVYDNQIVVRPGIAESHGIVVAEEGVDCCCGAEEEPCSENPCALCPDCTPTTYAVTFSGVILCSCANGYFGGFPHSVKQTGSLDGTYELAQISACEWEVVIPNGPVTCTMYQEWDCPTAGFVLATGNELRIVLTRDSSTTFVLHAQVQIVRFDGSHDAIHLFFCPGTAARCDEPFTVNNTLQDDANCHYNKDFTVFWEIFAYGGAATVDPWP